ncbi:MAG: hypothetical protein LBI67_01040 [Treponema sp.]|jgi:hypothetical protein|nr:hypothetical protein [Treponema sp.]
MKVMCGRVRGLRCAAALLVLFFAAASGFTQETADSILASYERHFIRANLGQKAGVLADAATDERAAEFLGPLYEFALRFTLENSVLFRDDPEMTNLVHLSVSGIQAQGYGPAAETLWQAFRVFPDNGTKIEILNTLAAVDSGDALAERLNRLLAEQNGFFTAGFAPNYPILKALVSVLGKVGNDESYAVLFEALVLPHNSEFLLNVENAIVSIGRGNLQGFLAKVILQSPIREKEEALRFGLRQNLGGAEQGALAEAALEAGLQGELAGKTGRYLRLNAARVIRVQKWADALPLAVKYFYASEKTYQANPLDGELKADLLDAIQCLGSIEDTDAASILGINLELANSRMEFFGECDTDIVTAIIDALGALGYKGVYDTLNRVGFLPYPENIKSSAREALSRLAW